MRLTPEIEILLARRRTCWTLLAAGIAMGHFSSFGLSRPIVTDIRYYLYFAARIAAGEIPYVDFFDNKTPLSYLTGSLLYKLGSVLGVEPLALIRVGYLGLAAVAAFLLFEIHRTLARGRAVPGFLALLALLGFSLLGVLPSIGNIPKLLMAMFVSMAFLLAYKHRWFAAGIAACLAFMDWQVGALGLVAIAVALFLVEKEPRRPALRMGLGALSGLTPFVAFYLAMNALDVVYGQVILASYARGTASAQQGLLTRLSHIIDVVQRGCAGHEWLVLIGVAGMLVYPRWVRRHWRRRTGVLACALAIYHYGIVIFSLVDFQGYGDLFILLHSIVFFTGVAVVELYSTAWKAMSGYVRGLHHPARQRARLGFQVIAITIMLVAILPSLLRRPLSLAPLTGPTEVAQVSLEEQRQASRALNLLSAGKRIAFIDHAELAFLADRPNALPFVYWNRATHAYFRHPEEKTMLDSLDRILEESAPDVIVPGRWLRIQRRLERPFELMTLATPSHGYDVEVLVLLSGNELRPPSENLED